MSNPQRRAGKGRVQLRSEDRLSSGGEMGLQWSYTCWRRAARIYRAGVHDASVVRTLFSPFREINSSVFQMSLKLLLCRLVQVLISWCCSAGAAPQPSVVPVNIGCL